MPKKKTAANLQPELMAESQVEHLITLEEQAEKERYRQRLAEYLNDPVFRRIEGFPIGEDEAILALSDPPYYTACPNPFTGEIIARWQQERSKLRPELGLSDDSLENGAQFYHREPFAADVSEGKNDPIYNAHSYHTKVPYKAIMRYILHYTEPGDIVLDGFCGTGMTGVAAQMCGDKNAIESLGYTVQKGTSVSDEKGQIVSRLGTRKAVLADLSPAATFIAYNFNTPVDARIFEYEAKSLLGEVEKEYGWMYETWHPNCDSQNRVKGRINFTVWSDVFSCPHCGCEQIYWDVAVNHDAGEARANWNCASCNTLLAKTPAKGSGAIKAERLWETAYDRALGKLVKRAKQQPVLINYTIGKKRCEKKPDLQDLEAISNIDDIDIPYPIPTDALPNGYNTQQPIESHGITHVNQFYTHRNLCVLSSIWHRIKNGSEIQRRLGFWFTSSLTWCGRENRLHLGNYFGKSGGVITSLRGTWYIASLSVETNVLERFRFRLSSSQFDASLSYSDCVINAQSATYLTGLSNCIDYIFIDPPFGANLMYSELNFVWEAWLRVFTNNKPEAIMNKVQRKELAQYQYLMELSFQQFYRSLKPGRWMTVEFHNSQNAVWNAIQEALLSAGFMVADVRTLDKGKGSFKQVTTTTATKQDLIISAYKPDSVFERNFLAEGGSSRGVWNFVRQHLEQLPMPNIENSIVEILAERQIYLLYDRMVAFHIVHGLAVPLSSLEFYQGIAQRYLERDGMYFTPTQAAEYDRLRLKAERVEQLALFVTDEKSAVQWLNQVLDPNMGGEPQTYQDLQPRFVQQLHQARHEMLPELREMLDQNFLQDGSGRWYRPDPERKADLEALRQKTLLREYSEYLKGKGRLKVFRSEAVRMGFSYSWKERKYADIVEIAERLPESVLQEDQGLLMYYHNASLRLAGQPKQTGLF